MKPLANGKILFLIFSNILIVVAFIAVLLGATTLSNKIEGANEDVLKFEQVFLTQQQENAADRMSKVLGLINYENSDATNSTKKDLKDLGDRIGYSAETVYNKYKRDQRKAKLLLTDMLTAMLDNSGYKQHSIITQAGKIIALNGSNPKNLTVNRLKEGSTKKILSQVQSTANGAEGGFFIKLYKDENSFSLQSLAYAYKIEGLNWIVTFIRKDFSTSGSLEKTVLTKIKDYTSRSYQPIHILNKDGVVLYSSVREDVGQNITNRRDAKNAPYVKDLLNQIENKGRALVISSSQKGDEQIKKVTIGRAVAEFNWIVMITNNGLNRTALESVHIDNAEFSSQNDIVILFIVLVFSLAVGYFLAVRVANTITKDIQQVQQNAFSQEQEIRKLQDRLDGRSQRSYMEDLVADEEESP
jgi:hypothetical protein